MNTQFEPGQTYQTRFACDYDSVLKMTVISRTAKTIKVDLGCFGEKTLRVSTKWSAFEQVNPLGSYSMAPCIDASDRAN